MHAVTDFARDTVMPESGSAPLAYSLSSNCKTRDRLQDCSDHGIDRFVFSSTAAVYGEPDAVPVRESAPTRPANPYCSPTMMAEWLLRYTARPHGLRPVIPRYLHVAGADPEGRRGQGTGRASVRERVWQYW